MTVASSPPLDIPTFEEVMAEAEEPERAPWQSPTLQEAWDRVKAALPIEMGFDLGLNELMNNGKADATPWVATAHAVSKAHYLSYLGGAPKFGKTEIEALDKLAAQLEDVEHR